MRQYRFLLRTAPVDALEHAHAEALGAMQRPVRAAVLTGVHRGLVAGLRLDPDDTRRIAHLLVSGERRHPGDFLRACPLDALRLLAEGVLAAEASFGLFGGYAAWDGTEPAAEHGEWEQGGFDPKVGRWAPADDPRITATGGGGAMSGGGGGA